MTTPMPEKVKNLVVMNVNDVDAVSNATYSSKAAVEAINLAIQAYQEVRGN